jgi:hypothetical protein
MPALKLPTFTNLKKWGKHASVNCHLCENTVKHMLFHVLVHCNYTMDQGRMTWRHESILKYIVGCLKSALESLLKCTATWKDCRPRVAGRSRLRSWRRHRDQTWSSLTGQSMAGIEYPWSRLHIPRTLTLIRPGIVRSLGMQASRRNRAIGVGIGVCIQ